MFLYFIKNHTKLFVFSFAVMIFYYDRRFKRGAADRNSFFFHLYYNVVYGPSCIKDGHYVEVIFIWYKYYRYDFYMRVYLFFNKLNGRELRLSKCQIFIFVFNEYENWQVLIAFYLFIDIYLLYIFAIRSHHQLCCINIICYSLNFYTHLKKKETMGFTKHLTP